MIQGAIKIEVPSEAVFPYGALVLGVEAAKPGRTSEVKVKIVAPVQPVPPKRQHPHVPPSVVFEGITLTPYVDSARCNGSSTRCRGRQAYSIRATGMRAPTQADYAAVRDPDSHVDRGDG
jgi:hypothetical protein